MKIVINRCFGGFGLSHEAMLEYFELSKIKVHYEKDIRGNYNYYVNNKYFHDSDIERNDENLIKAIEKIGEEASGEFAVLKIIEIPDDIEWEITNYDGMESVIEKHRSWF